MMCGQYRLVSGSLFFFMIMMLTIKSEPFYQARLNEQAFEQLSSHLVTPHGRYFLKEDLLATPLSSMGEISQRQELIHFFLHQRKKLSDVRAKLAAISGVNDAWKARYELLKVLSADLYKSLYYKNEQYNNSPTALTIGQLIGSAGLIMIGFTIKDAYEVIHAWAKPQERDPANVMMNRPIRYLQWLHLPNTVLLPTLLGFYLWTLYDVAGFISSRKVMISNMHNVLKKFRYLLDVSREFYSQLKDSPMAHHARYFSHFAALSNGQWEQENSDFAQFMTMINDKAFTEKASTLIHMGKVLATYHQMMKCDGHLFLLSKALGELDAYSSVASLMATAQDVQSPKTQWCFVQFHASKPHEPFVLKLNNLVCPNAERADDALSCDFAILPTVMAIQSTTEKPSSDVIHVLNNALVLAHSLGIMPACYSEMTFFDHVLFYAGEQINEPNQQKLFVEQSYRVNKLIAHLGTDLKDKRVLVLMHEPFQGVEAAMASRMTSKLFGRLDQFSHLVGLVATDIIADDSNDKAQVSRVNDHLYEVIHRPALETRREKSSSREGINYLS